MPHKGVNRAEQNCYKSKEVDDELKERLDEEDYEIFFG